ncbi:flagellar hook-length control protein [Bradyrhizobiaceae bacterium SG-6C]|nr:flagellar hook-length control protein [Bradyrhizobiaceae bacterium SG-6C]
MFSVTPEPAVSKPAFDPQPRQARADQSSPDGFAALVDSNAAADSDRPSRPAPDAPRRDTRGTDAPPPANDRQPSDKPATAANDDSGKAQQDAEPAKTADASTTGGKSSGKTKSESGDTTSDDTSTDSDAAAAVAASVIPAIVTDPVAVVIAAAATPVTAAPDESASATASAATAAIIGVSTVTASAETAVAQTAATTNGTAASAAATTDPSAAAEATATPEAATAVSTAVQIIKPSDSGKAEAVAKNDETSPSKDSKDSKQAADPSAKPVTDQAIKPETGPEQGGDKSQPHEKTASEAGSTETDSSKHTAKTTQQAEHRSVAPAPQHALPTDPALVQPSATPQQQPIQTHAANLTAIPVPTANSTLADAPVPLNGLAADIALRAAGGNSRFEIRLDPAELGRIDVRLDVDKHGNVTSHLTVERPSTLDMLRNDAPRLQQALEDAGLKTGDSGLQFSLRDQSSSGRDGDNGSGRNSQRVVIAEEDTVPAQIAGRTYGRMLGASSGVDIRI